MKLYSYFCFPKNYTDTDDVNEDDLKELPKEDEGNKRATDKFSELYSERLYKKYNHSLLFHNEDNI